MKGLHGAECGNHSIYAQSLNDTFRVVPKLEKLYTDNGLCEQNKTTLLAAIEAGSAASHRAIPQVLKSSYQFDELPKTY